MTFTFFLTLLFLPFSLFQHASAAAVAAEGEIRSLMEFRKGIKSDPSNRIFSTWVFPSNLSACPASFHGVSCDPSNSAVTAIALDRLGLSGELKFNTLVQLASLQNLTVSGNSLSGRLVPTLGLITSLQVVDLSGNQFYGPIPSRLYTLWDVRYLNLSNNNFSGWFPSGISNLQQLRALDLHSNHLKGDLQGLISELRNVEYLDLSGNEFFLSVGLDAQNISNLANTLQYVNLSGNVLGAAFWGTEEIKFWNLRVLDLSHTGLAGELPDFGQFPYLQVLQLRSNDLSASLPAGLLQGDVPLLKLDLSGNGFSGSIPNINSTTLEEVNLSSNFLTGSLPPSSGNCRVLDLSSNMLSDDISVLTNWNSQLEIVDLSSNKLTGNLPNLTQFQRLTFLSIRNNSLEGTLPSSLGSNAKISSIDVSSNRFDGRIPRTFFTSATLLNLNLSGNLLTGSIPLEGSQASELLVLTSVRPLESLDLSRNSLAGGLAPDIGDFARLKLLNLANNRLSGQLPHELSKLSGLEYIDLSNNSFNSHIPDGLLSSLKYFNVSYNNLSGSIPENLRHFPISSFTPGNSFFNLPGVRSPDKNVPNNIDGSSHHSSRNSIRVAIIVACVGAAVMIAFVLLAYHRARLQDFRVRSGFCAGRDVKLGGFGGPSLLRLHNSGDPPPSSLSFSNDHLLTSNSRSFSTQVEARTEMVENVSAKSQEDIHPTTSGRRSSSPGSPIASSPSFIDTIEQPVTLDVYSPDRLAGELFFLDTSLKFTAEQLSRAPAEVLGRSSHGTLYKATLDNGHMLTVKWLRVGLVKHKKEFAKEVKKIGSVRHENVVPLRAYYWGPREQERLILADYIQGDSLALHLYETTPRRYCTLQFTQRLKVAVDVARCLMFLHDRGLPHGNLKPTNVLLEGTNYIVRLTDYGLHRLMTQTGIAEQILNLGALGYRAPELASSAKPSPSFKADVYAFGVILMELLTRRSAGDIISGQSGAVDLTDWVRMCDQEGRGMDCIDREIASGEEHLNAMNDMLAISLRCILPVNERPNIKQVLEDLCSIAV